MEITLPTDCGNAPRIGIVTEIVTAWASGDGQTVSTWMSEDVTWTVVGDVTHEGRDAAVHACQGTSARSLEIAAVITHGRLAACDGFVETESGRVSFSHAFRFAGAAKSATVKELRSYCIRAMH
ncbi:hypothetical protein L5G32_06805 [Gordonia sp. HY002]|uniref:hypothetical protein n=1 Tax=Gordonia zhenghanii TaxID=2911516 RepID=UPI001EF0A0D1|nr:hypothetical protein [Gordonia zhenghanii]MCF8569973.1 hypothetical protein [Gordonia zhenghanii]MCF8604342.1 hypothetical protein [Gordonia zhenghanii]